MIPFALGLAIRVIGRGDLTRIKWERGGGSKNLTKLRMWSLY